MTDLASHLSASAVENITAWLTEPKYIEYIDELQAMIDNEQWRELEDSFFTVIEFGTGGRRGKKGIGSNRINRVTIGESAQALCLYAASIDSTAAEKGIVIAYDTRISSPELSEYAATVCAANGFKTYIFDSFRSTPELSFAVRYLGAAVGIVISASHNPPSDNGFKAYWSDGGQLVSPHAEGVMSQATAINRIISIEYSEAVRDGRITIIGDEIDSAYVHAAAAESEGEARTISIVYSPLHGAGQTNVLPVLKMAGFQMISNVEDQMIPDGNFPTIEGGKPNPEEKIANDRAVAQLMAEKADIAITNDPDADRIGVIVRHEDRPVYLSGNQSAILAANFVLKKMKQRQALTSKHYIAKTIVTTDMLTALADAYNVKMYTDMLIGFKYIGELMTKKEASDEVFVIGAEESYGLLKGDYARDKDGAAGALPLAEYAAELKLEVRTLYDELLALYKQHGVYAERLDSAYFEGASGFKRMQTVMRDVRLWPPVSIGEFRVTAVLDYKLLQRHDIVSGDITSINCVAGDVVALELDGDSRRRVTIRPSGTEPKIKLYTQWFTESTEDIEAQVEHTAVLLSSISKILEGMLLE